jgi:hypothetical protein
MASTFVNNLRVAEPADGDSDWGTSTNTSLELIGEALGFGTEAITTNADTHTSTVADGSSDQARAMYLKYTGTLDSTCTITIGPNTIKRFQIIENATSGSQSIIISQGSGANVTIANGGVKAVYLDGAGSGAAVLDAFVDLDVGGTFTVGTAANGVSITNGAIDLKNSGAQSYIRFYCESSNAHYAEVKAPAHSAFSGNVTLTLPVTTSNLVGDSATQTLTNKTINASNNTLSNIPMSATSFSAGTGVTLSTNTLNVDAAQTGITSLLATDIKIGEDDETKIDFETADTINFYAGNEKQLILTDGALTPGTNAILDLGTDALEFKDAFFDGTVEADAISIAGTAISATAAEINKLDGVTATTTEINYLDITTLGTTEASKVVTADANGVVKFDNGIQEESTAITSSSNAATLNLRDGTVFTHTLSENVTYTFSNPAASGYASGFTLKVTQDSSARTITWPGSVDWAGGTAPTLSTGSGDVDVFVFLTEDGGTTYYGFTAGQDMS